MKKHAEVHMETTPTHHSVPADDPLSEAAIQEEALDRPPREMRPANGSNGQTESALPAEQLLAALKAVKRGDFQLRLAGAWPGVAGQVADTFNELAQMLSRSTEDLTRISRLVGQEGKIQERISFDQATAGWAERVNSVNALIDWLAQPVSETVRVIEAVAKGDL